MGLWVKNTMEEQWLSNHKHISSTSQSFILGAPGHLKLAYDVLG